jgi:hypothetical protein
VAIVRLDRGHDRFGRPGTRWRRHCFATIWIVSHPSRAIVFAAIRAPH